jgi:hypothetical protein
MNVSEFPGGVPPSHELQVLVRQVEPGSRIRVAFCRNLACPIPNDDAVLRATFDLNLKDGKPGAVLTVREVAGLAVKYAATEDGAPS